MQYPTDSALWRLNFVGALQLLGQAAARQPFGIPDPVLCGASAVELYTGGLWFAGCLEVFAADARSLIVELFPAGFRWTRRPRYAGRGLWHPGLQIGIDIINDRKPRGLGEQSDMLTVAVDLGVTGPADRELVSLKVVGIEDLSLRRLPAGGRTGRHREMLRLECKCLEGSDGKGSEAGFGPVTRIIALARMRALITAWRVRSGLSFDRSRLELPRVRREKRAWEMRCRNDESGGGCERHPVGVPAAGTS
jgi:hypothetical protein